MEFHPEKCEVIPITRNRNIIKNNYTLNGHILKTTTNAKYLGVTITSDLRWNQHVNNKVKSANSSLGLLKRNLKISNKTLKTQAYFTFVRPLVEYASPVWDPHTDSNIHKIEMVQHRAARFVFNKYMTSSEDGSHSVTKMLESLGWKSLEQRRTEARLVLMYKIVYGLVLIPIESYLVPHHRHSRHYHDLAYQIPHSNNNYHQFSFFPRTVRIWNALPQEVVHAQTIDAFKSQIAAQTY